MRVDKYLKVARIIKRRTIAGEACSQGRVSLNGKTVKASAEVKVGDLLTVAFGQNEFRARVTSVKEHVKKEEAADMYEVTEH